MPHFPLSELMWLALAVIAAGWFTGILAGLFGVGGGAVIVPALYEVFRVLDVPADVRMQLCIGSSLAIIVPTTVRSYFAHRAMGVVIPQVVRLWVTARCSWRHPWVAGFGLGSGRPLQDLVCDFRGVCQRQDV